MWEFLCKYQFKREKVSAMAGPIATIVAGANGSGKTTITRLLALDSVTYLNADLIEKELGIGAMAAGRIMLERMSELTRHRRNFAVETTLAGKWTANRMQLLKMQGYQVRIVFVWIHNADLAIARVASRVRSGGHAIPEGVIRKRYKAGIQNFLRLGRSLADGLLLYDNSGADEELVAYKFEDQTVVLKDNTWSAIQSQFTDGTITPNAD